MKSGVRAEENQEKRGQRGGKPRKAGLERKKTKKSVVRAADIREKHG